VTGHGPYVVVSQVGPCLAGRTRVLIQETNSWPPGGHAGAFDVLFPTQEQVAVLAAAGVGTAVPSFAALAAVQDKVSAFAMLTHLGLPQPPAAVGTYDDDVQRWRDLPAYVKR
jgi:hypothetical protein